MPREFKPIRFFVIMAALVFLTCAVTAFYTARARHGQTSDERSAYAIGQEAGEKSTEARLPYASDLNNLAQERFTRQGTGEPMAWKLAFEKGYEAGYNSTHPSK